MWKNNNTFYQGTVLIPVLFFYVSIGFAQISVHPVTTDLNINNKQGVFYALPRTLIKVDLEVKKTEHYAGPYAEYAGKYLDLENVTTTDYNEYAITEVKLGTISEPDPDHYYFAEINHKSLDKGQALLFSLNESGLAVGLNGTVTAQQVKDLAARTVDQNEAKSSLFEFFAESSQYEKTDTIIHKVVVDTVIVKKVYLDRRMVEKSNEQKAVEAAKMIGKIRESRYNMISGYQEIAYDGSSISLMASELQKMEKEYLSLFTGITIEKTIHYSFTVLPDPKDESGQIPVFVFSERSGIKEPGSQGGEKVSVKIEPSGEIGQLSAISEKRESSSKGDRGFYYRIPVSAKLSIDVNNDLKVQGIFPIAQYGTISYLPPFVTTVQFHLQTGEIRNMIVQ